MKVSRSLVVKVTLYVVFLAGLVITFVAVSRWEKGTVQEGTVTGFLKLSSAGEWTFNGTSHAMYLVDIAGKKYRLLRATSMETYNEIVAVREGSWIEVTGRFWRPKKQRTRIVGGGGMYDGPEMTDDPIDSIEGADFILEADTVKVR